MIEIKNLSIALSGFSLRDIDLSISKGEFFILLGPTGSGKSLTLEAIAGMVPISDGSISIAGGDVTGLAPEKRGVGIVYQDYSLFPHLTVMENIRYGLAYHKADLEASEARIEQLIDRLGIGRLMKRSVNHLSGGEKQRVALARALAVNPSVLLLDEPLSALDTGFRDDIQKLLKNLHNTMDTTFLMVTHDFTEALFLGERAAVINNGRIEQVGDVADVFTRPKTAFVARFVGIRNVFEAKGEGSHATMGGLKLNLNGNGFSGRRHLAIRAEDIRIRTGPSLTNGLNGLNTFCARVVDMLDRGPYGELTVRINALVFTIFLKKSELLNIHQDLDDTVSVTIPPHAIHVV